MAVIEYLYELRRVEELVATGRLTRDSRFQVGDRVEIVGQPGIVKTTEPEGVGNPDSVLGGVVSGRR